MTMPIMILGGQNSIQTLLVGGNYKYFTFCHDNGEENRDDVMLQQSYQPGSLQIALHCFFLKPSALSPLLH